VTKNSHPDRARRRADAAARQAKRDARTNAEQLALIATRRGASTKERARLEQARLSALPKETP
jgi:hypothetical protein